ncbi:MAG TPA: hypothetical protein VJ063_18700 [Verrucomicrobiae bacterium]|nr:hypothetical protein [Verrucomicrobiae bacterium]
MFNRLKSLFGAKRKEPEKDPQLKAAEEWYDRKSKLMEEILGPEHDMVMHAIIPYPAGGGLDLYYYARGIPGTAIATKELSELPNEGSRNNEFSCYELAMFTRHPLNLDQAWDDNTGFGQAHSKINSILHHIALYSAQAELNPGETCEFPAEMKCVGGKCLIFDAYGSRSDATVRNFGILLIIEVFRSEMDFARANGGAKLITKLKAAGHYPYSDLERSPVV